MYEIYKTIDGRYRGKRLDSMTHTYQDRLTLLRDIVTDNVEWHWQFDPGECDLVKTYKDIMEVYKDLPDAEKYL